MKRIIYLDNGATTQVHKEVAAEMNKSYIDNYGNPSSPHALGEKAQKAMNEAREKLAREIGAKPLEIIFTSGGTEANNLALFGFDSAYKNKKKIIISRIEHSSIYESCLTLRKEGYEIIEIPCDRDGLVNIEEIERNIDSNTLLLSIIHTNNEIGVLQDIERIGELCRKTGVLFHTDAVQSFGKERINVRDMNIDLLSASAHKIGGPKGIGFLYVRDGIKIKPLIIGGGQEAGRRGGTENVPGIIGFAKSLEISKKEDKERIRNLRDYFMSELEKIGGEINGSKEQRIYNNVNVSFAGADAEMLVLALSQKSIMCSTKSACLSKSRKESRILTAIGLTKKEIEGSVRFALSGDISKIDINYVLTKIGEFIKR